MADAPKDPPEHPTGCQVIFPPGTTLKQALRHAEERVRAEGPRPPDYAKDIAPRLRAQHDSGRR